MFEHAKVGDLAEVTLFDVGIFKVKIVEFHPSDTRKDVTMEVLEHISKCYPSLSDTPVGTRFSMLEEEIYEYKPIISDPKRKAIWNNWIALIQSVQNLQNLVQNPTDFKEFSYDEMRETLERFKFNSGDAITSLDSVIKQTTEYLEEEIDIACRDLSGDPS